MRLRARGLDMSHRSSENPLRSAPRRRETRTGTPHRGAPDSMTVPAAAVRAEPGRRAR